MRIPRAPEPSFQSRSIADMRPVQGVDQFLGRPTRQIFMAPPVAHVGPQASVPRQVLTRPTVPSTKMNGTPRLDSATPGPTLSAEVLHSATGPGMLPGDKTSSHPRLCTLPSMVNFPEHRISGIFFYTFELGLSANETIPLGTPQAASKSRRFGRFWSLTIRSK